MTLATKPVETTWGDCPNYECPFYGRMRYGIEPGDICDEGQDHGCGSTLRWWDRWHDGAHTGKRGLDVCLRMRTTEGGPA